MVNNSDRKNKNIKMKLNEKIIIKNKNEEEDTVLEIGEYK